MNIIDISWPISPSMTQYKDAQHVTVRKLEKPSSSCLEHLLTLHTHTGTHVDAPAHFIPGGETIEQIPLSKFIGPCRVLDLTHVTQAITKNDLTTHNIQADEIILLKTKNSEHAPTEKFKYDFIYLADDAATYLVQQKIKTIVIDYLGIERNQPEHPTHKALLSAHIPIIEGLRLEHVKAGTYMLYCLPLSLPGLDAAPARAILIQNS